MQNCDIQNWNLPNPMGFFSKSFRGWFPCLPFTTLWLLHVRLKLFQLLNMIMITQWDFLVKFILQVFKWYMFPGTQPHPTPSIQFFSNIPESKWKDIFLLTYPHKLYNMWIYFRAQGIQMFNQNIFHPTESLWLHIFVLSNMIHV